MAGISRRTALEIFTQPDDLEFRLGTDGYKFGFAITRGPGHDLKFLVTCKHVYESSEAAIKAIGELLEAICSEMTSELSTPSTMAAQFVNPEDRPLDDANVLSGEFRERILRDLAADGVAQTYTYKQARGKSLKKLLLLISNGVESFELAAFSDVMGWASNKGDEPVAVTRAALHSEITCTCGLRVIPDMLISDVNPDDYDAVAIPGGFGDAGFYKDAYSELFLDIIRAFNQAGKPIGSICVGALPIAKAGVLQGRRATTYHLSEGKRRQQLAEMGAIVEDSRLVVDNNVITSTSPATAVESALRLLALLTSEQNADHIKHLMGY